MSRHAPSRGARTFARRLSRRFSRTGASALALVLALAACGDDDALGPGDPSPTFDLVFDRRPAALPLSELYRLPGATGVAERILAPATLGGDASPSADGRLIAFVGAGPDDVDPQDIWIMRADGTDRRRIPLQGGIEYAPSLSPDGTRVAFIRVDDDGYSRLFVANVDGTSERQMTAQLPFEFRSTPAWSPDGTQLAFAAGHPGALAVWVVRADGAHAEQLTEFGAWSDFDPTWSPDGKAIAFVRTTGPRRASIVVLDLATLEERTIVPVAQNRHPAWSPDGSRIAFVSAMDGGSDQELYTVKPDGSGLVRLTTNDADERRPSWLRVDR